MKRLYILTVLYLIPYITLGTERPVTDSLLSVLNQATDTNLVHIFNDLAWEYRSIDTKKAYDYAFRAQHLSDSLSFESGGLTSLNRLGVIAFMRQDLEEAERFYLKILSEELANEDVYGIGRAYNQLGLIYKKQGLKKEALTHLIKAKDCFESLDKTTIVATVLNNIGGLYRGLGDYQAALSALLKSYDLRGEGNSINAIALSAQNLGLLYFELKDYDQAFYYLKQAKQGFYKTGNIYELSKAYKNIGAVFYDRLREDSAVYYFNKNIALRNTLSLEAEDADMYHNLGTIYFKQELYDKALEMFQQALEIEKSSETYRNIAHVYYKTDDIERSYDYYKKALAFSQELNNPVQAKETLFHLVDICQKLGDHDMAYTYNDKYIALRDSIETEYQKATNYRLAYQRQQKQMALLEKDKVNATLELEVQTAKNTRQTILIYALILALVLLILLFFAVLGLKKQKERASLAEKNHLLESQKVNNLLQGQASRSLNDMLIGQDKERKRIAQDLHDRFGGTLATIQNYFRSVESYILGLNEVDVKTRGMFRKANELLDTSCADIRTIAHNLHNSTLDYFGLIDSLEDLENKLNSSGEHIEVEFVSHGLKERLSSDLEVLIFDIIYILVGNVLIHSGAKELSIQLVKRSDSLNLLVEDDGQGFDVNTINKGMGLKSIESKVQSVEGKLVIDSNVGKGTTVVIDIPLKEENTL